MIFKKEHLLLQKAVRKFAEEEVLPYAAEREKEGAISRDLMEKLARYKYTSPIVPKEYGGAGADYTSYVIIMEEISKKCASTGTFTTAAASLVSSPLLNFGTEEQKQKYLTRITSGEAIGAFGLTEPGAGSDAGGQTTTAVLDGDSYILNGRKTFITNAPIADFAIVIAVTERGKGVKGTSAFIVDMNLEGVSCGAHEDKMGIRATETSDLIFENVRVPKENILGKEGQGFKVAMKTLDGGRIGIAAQALGIAQGAIDETVAYVKERKQFGKSISQFQNTQFQLASLAAKVEAARLLVYKAADCKDRGLSYSVEAATAKLIASETAMEVTTKCLQLFGGYGYTREYPIERMMRDAKITEIYEGTSEVQRMVIAANLLK